MKYTLADAQTRWPNVIWSGDTFYIGTRALIGEGAIIGTRALIGEGADIREGAVIITLCDKYTGNISPTLDTVWLRIGCEIHPLSKWATEAEEIAQPHCQKINDKLWWETRGRRMLAYLMEEAELYRKEK